MDQMQESQEDLILQHQLGQALVAEQFLTSDTGRLWTQIATNEVNLILKDITSEKYIKDHQGYVNALADLRAYKNMIKRMQLAGSPARIKKLRERLNKFDEVKEKA